MKLSLSRFGDETETYEKELHQRSRKSLVVNYDLRNMNLIPPCMLRPSNLQGKNILN